MENPEEESLIQYPCRFPIKVMGKADADFDALVVSIFRRHCGDLPEGAVKTRLSTRGNYMSVTVTIMAQSRKQLDDLYRELSGHERVNMVL